MRVSQKCLINEIDQINQYTDYKYNIRLNTNKQLEIEHKVINFKSNTDAMSILKSYHNEAVNNCIKKYGSCTWF